jgi:hypothetical protein
VTAVDLAKLAAAARPLEAVGLPYLGQFHHCGPAEITSTADR